MLKITAKASKTGRCFVLEGRISGPWVDELQRLCETALDGNQRLTLDLTQVSYIDIDGVSLFRRLLRHEVVLVGASPFVSEQLKSAR